MQDENSENKGLFFDELVYEEASGTLVSSKTKTVQVLETGQVCVVQAVTKKAVNQKQFWKLYLTDFLQVLGILESKQIDVLIYILDNTPSATNTFLGTYRKIATETGVSLDTVRRVMKKLQDTNFILKIQNGAYLVSPKILMKGRPPKQALLLEYYYDNGGYEQEQTNAKADNADVKAAKQKLKKYKKSPMKKAVENLKNKAAEAAEADANFDQMTIDEIE